MTHNEPRSHWIREGFIGLGTGILFGVTVVGVGHPFDTIKTLMQAQPGFENMTMYKTFKQILKTDGFKGFYRGCVPPLWGSGVYRSIQFFAFESVYTLADNNFGKTEIPLTNGIQIRVILGGIASGTLRSLVETPLEYAKTHRQMGMNWNVKDCYTGFGITCLRANVLMPFYFIFFDSCRRHFDGFFSIPFFGPFLTSGCSSVLAWWVCWPLEYMKCQIQGNYLEQKHMTLIQRLRYVVKERGGFLALYRGIMPGSLRSFVGNGSAMVVMQWAQKKVSEMGWRD